MGSLKDWLRSWLTTPKPLIEVQRSIQVPSVKREVSVGNDGAKVADFKLPRGRWAVLAKATMQGYGGNDRVADGMLTVNATENGHKKSDETYESAGPLLGGSMTVILGVDVESLARIEVSVHAQGPRAEFKHIVVVAIRES